MYRHFVKPLIDFVLALIGTIVLAVPLLLVALAIYFDDPGNPLFRQRRVGQKKNGEITYFTLYKFRSMRMDTPHDRPTHELENPEKYITKVGRFLRKYSIDELVQIPLNILTMKISIIGPRPALWNQDNLVAEREKYGANDIKPGLTGWAQINGRDELEIPFKAKYDGKYAADLMKGGFTAFKMDLRCFFGTIVSVFKHEGVVEGGTGAFHRKEEEKKEVTK